jgi:hypothetical protein
MERVKNLVLSGRIPLHEAPESMADHPIMMIERHCKRLIAARRAKAKEIERNRIVFTKYLLVSD